MSPNLNTAGLHPVESKALPERYNVQPQEQKILKAIRETTFDIYAENAIFHDPVGIATGPDSIRAQFVALTKMFPRADIVKLRVLEIPPNLSSNIILIDQDVSYFHDVKAASPTKTLNSLLTLEINEQHQVTRHTEQWNHEKSSTSSDGFLGMLNEHRKKMTARLTDRIVDGGEGNKE